MLTRIISKAQCLPLKSQVRISHAILSNSDVHPMHNRPRVVARGSVRRGLVSFFFSAPLVPEFKIFQVSLSIFRLSRRN